MAYTNLIVSPSKWIWLIKWQSPFPRRSNTGATAYATTNACLVALTKQMALELAQNKIRVV
jgi:NAD(P)-dependent dehydrogenase (short-subunit alcohol dehydrogenase family)